MTVEEDLSEERVVFDIPNDIEDQSSSQGFASIEEEENLVHTLMADEVITNEMLPELTYRSSEKVTITRQYDGFCARGVYDWRIAFAEKQFEEITNRFEQSDWTEQPTNEEAMYFAARAYHALGNLNQALVIKRSY